MTYPVRYGGDSGNRIFVLYWRCPLIRVSVIRGSTVFEFMQALNFSVLLKISVSHMHIT